MNTQKVDRPEEAASPLGAGRPDHLVDVMIAGTTVTVSPDYVRIRAGESVQWRFRGVQGRRRPEIRFVDAKKELGPFERLELACSEEPTGGKIYTITGVNADTIPRTYEYEAGVTVTEAGVSKWIGLDPILDNEGKPPGAVGEPPEHPDQPQDR